MPKKEYVRCKLIRGHKRAIRQILAKQIPKTTIHKFDPADSKAQSLWALMKQNTDIQKDEFEEKSKTEAGPITDGKAKRTEETVKDSFRSFNASFCKAYFENPGIRESFSLYIDLIFSNFDPQVLSNKFEFRCCRNETHSLDCLEKWASLMGYLKGEMIRELGWEPIDISNFFVSLPSFGCFLDTDDEDS